MRRKWRRFAAGLLSIIMLITMLPAEALAANSGSKENQSGQTMPFQDVKSSDWYAEAVEYVYSHNIFSGTSATTFTPNGTMTRGMFVTVLGRMAGVNSGDYSGETSFSDVPQTMYYAPYVQWAAKYGITTGTSKGKFSPDAFIDRAQMAVFFVRYFETLGVDYDTGTDIASEPADMASIPAYAQDAVRKLWKQGLLNGDGKRFAPADSATRAQMAALCMRADGAVKVWYSAPGVVGRKSGETSNKDNQSQPNNNSGGGSSGGGSSSGTSRTITLHLPDGTTSTFTQTGSALSLDNLPTPSIAGKAFIGWYYDEGYSKAVLDGDPVSADLSLYAKMVDYKPTKGVETPTYTGATDVGPDFTITIKSSSSSDLTDKIKLIGTEQPTGTDDTSGDAILSVGSVTKNSDGTYTVAPPKGSWVKGGTYKVVLEDDSLTFEGEETSVREYHFTVEAGKSALDWHLKDDVKPIPADAVRAITQDGKAVAAFDMPVVTFDGSSASTDSVSFVYTGNPLAVGDTVAVYEGTAPDDRVAVGTNDANTGDVSYVKITKVDEQNHTYDYQAAAVEDVLFVPDVLPVQASHKEADSHTILVPVEELTFTAADAADAAEVNKLDESTTVDVGDFLAFYKGSSYKDGEAASDGYGLIKTVDYTTDDFGAVYYRLTYTDATEDDVLSSMDVDTSDPVSGNAILANTDIDKLEQEIAQQAMDSGFAQSVADRISAALDAMDPNDLTADGEIDLSTIDLDPDGTFGLSALSGSSAVPLAGGNAGGKKSNTKGNVKNAQIKKTLENFKDASGNGLSGVRLELQLEVKKTIEKDGGSIVITVTPTFIQELKIDLSTHGKLVWKHKFIIYWISDVYLEAGLNVYTYTAINLDATIVSQGEDDTVTKVKDLVSKLGKKLDALEGKDTDSDSESTEIDTSKLSLQELHSSMLDMDSSWVELYRKNIFSLKKTVAKIIKFELTTDFVIEMNIRMAMGMNFNYTNAKRYVFGIYIFKGKTTSNTYNLVNEQYNLRLYAMGAIGLRAGVELYPSVSLISRNVATVGIVAKVGAYIKGYGYVLYNLHHTAGQPNTSNASGALYVEVGMFMDISANLSAFKGKLSWTPELYTDETPLWSVGSTHAITAFDGEDAADEDDTPTVYLKNGGLDTVLPESLQMLTGFDLTTGKERTEVYDWDNFDISFDDPRFTTNHTGDYGGNYSQQHVKLKLDDWKTTEEPEIDCVMTLTYKGSDLSFSTNPVQRKVKVHWDRLQDGYPIHELNEYGGYIGWEQQGYKTTLNLTTPTRVGYNFTGWTYYLLKDESNIFSYTKADLYTGTTMPESALVAVAKFEPRTDIPYTLNFYLQDEKGKYPDTPTESVVGYGTADSDVVPNIPYMIGYRYPGAAGFRIRADGTSTQNYYYSREPYTITLRSNGEVSNVPYRYGDTLNLPDAPTRLGYTFGGWYENAAYTTKFTATKMPDRNVTLYAKWEPNYITYFVVLRKEGADGKWTQTTEIQTGQTDKTVPLDPEEFLTPAELDEYDYPETVNYTVSAEDGGTVYISYARKRFNLTYDLNATDTTWVSKPRDLSIRLGAPLKLLTENYMKRAGYTFDGWYTDPDCTDANAFAATTMPDHDVKLYAKWTAQDNISYTVEHYQQNVTGDEYTLVSADTETKIGVTGEKTEAVAKDYTGFTAQDITQETINGNGKTVVKVYYTRNEYTLTYNLNDSGASWTDSAAVTSRKYRFGAKITTPGASELSRAGYAFGGWYTDEECKDKFTATEMPAADTKLYAKWNAGQVNYTVNYYLQDVDGTAYPENPSETSSGSGVTGQSVNVQKSYEGFTLDESQGSPTSITLKADSAQNVVDIYYTRNQYALSYVLGDNVTWDEGSSALADGDTYYGAEISTDMTNAKRTGYTFVGWYTNENCTTKWYGDTMPAHDLTLYAKWDVLTYFLHFDWDGNVPLRDWLLDEKVGGKLLTAEYDTDSYTYINANTNGIPYIEVPVKYDEEFTLPTDIPGVNYFGYYKEEESEWGYIKETFVKVEGTSLINIATNQDDIVKVGAAWKYDTDTDGATMIYNASQFQDQVVRGSSSDTQYALGVDLDLCNVNMTSNDGMPVANITFNGKDHTIFHVKRGETISRDAAGTLYGYGDNVTVKNLTIDGMTIDYTATVDAQGNYYHAFGALAGYVGNGFTAQKVTVKNVTMNLDLLGEGASTQPYHLLPAESIGGLIGYTTGSAALTDCTVENMVVNVTDSQVGGATKFLVGGLIGYADALYTPYENGAWADSSDYRGNGRVTTQNCAVTGMTVNQNGAKNVTVGGLLGGICKSAASKDEMAYTAAADIDDASTCPTEFEHIGNELDSTDSGDTATQSLVTLFPIISEDKSDEEGAAA